MVAQSDEGVENRKRIIECLVGGRKTWREIQKETGFSSRTIAKHLKRLIEDGLVVEEVDPKDRRIRYYRLVDKALDEIREDLVAFKIFLMMERALLEQGKIVAYSDLVNLYERIVYIVGNTFLLTCPDNVHIFATAVQLFCEFNQDYFKAIREIVVPRDFKELIERIKRRDTKALFNEIASVLREMIITWECLARTPPEEVEKVVRKYSNKENVKDTINFYLAERERAIERLNKIKNTWLYKVLRIEEKNVPTFEEFFREVYLKNRG